MNPNQKPYDSIAVIGPTASGKTQLAVRIAAQWKGEILSIDSRMVYKHMDIGTGKDLNEYFVAGNPIPYHLINLVEPHESYHLYQFQQDFKQAFSEVKSRNHLPILCGGSGLYLEAVILDHTYTSIPANQAQRQAWELLNLTQLQELFWSFPKHPYQQKADIQTKKRCIRVLEICAYLQTNPEFSFASPEPIHPLIIGLNPNLELRRKRIQDRLNARLEEGLIAEVEALLHLGIHAERLDYFGLEYKFVKDYLLGIINYQELLTLLNIAIRQFAKRQMTFFRKMEKAGIQIHWVADEADAWKYIETCF